MLGFGVGGNIPIDATIVIEFLPKNRRFLLAALSTFQVSVYVEIRLTLAHRSRRRFCHCVWSCAQVLV
jgi:hypothetical protein